MEGLLIPLDLVSQLTAFFDSQLLCRLWTSGNRLFTRRLEQGGVVFVKHEVYHAGFKFDRIRIPFFLSSFSQLRHLCIETHCTQVMTDNQYDPTASIEPMTLTNLPTSLESIIFLSPARMPSHLPLLPVSPFLNRFHRLSSLIGMTSLDSTGLIAFENRLTHITVHQWDHHLWSPQSFPYLIFLHITSYAESEFGDLQAKLVFPPNLTDLALPGHQLASRRGYRMGSDMCIPTWPANLQKLKIGEYWAEYDLCADFLRLIFQSFPKTLKHLEITDKEFVYQDGCFEEALSLRSLKIDKIEVSDFKFLSRTLTSLVMPDSFVPSDELDCLPPELTHLECRYKGKLDGEDLPKMLEILKIRGDYLNVQALPSDLTHLSIDSMVHMLILDAYPKSLTIAELALCQSQNLEFVMSALPETLTRLDVDCRQYDPDSEWLDQLPKRLKHLSLVGLISNSKLSVGLPPGLVSLSIRGPYSSRYNVTSECFAQLPRSLTTVHLDLVGFDPTQLAALPPALTLAVFNSPTHGELPLRFPPDVAHRLPPRLRTLVLDYFFLNTSELTAALPRCNIRTLDLNK